MYLFERKEHIQFFKKPFPYFYIDNALPVETADALEERYPIGHKHGLYKDDKLWLDFVQHNLDRIQETINFFDNIFKLPNDTLSTPEINYPHFYNDRIRIIRDWHLDGDSKKYQIIYYLGNHSKGGEFEIKGKRLPFTHNRVFVFPRTPKSWHKFYSVVGWRKTFNIPLYYT